MSPMLVKKSSDRNGNRNGETISLGLWASHGFDGVVDTTWRDNVGVASLRHAIVDANKMAGFAPFMIPQGSWMGQAAAA